MTCIEKFTFARRFPALADPAAGAPAPSVPSPMHSDADLERARSEAYAAGHAEGRAEGFTEGEAQAKERAQTAREQRELEAQERVAEHLTEVIAQHDTIARQAEHGALSLALAALRKALPGLHRRYAAVEIEAMVADLPESSLEPTGLRIALHPDFVDAVGDRLGSTFAARDLTGRVAFVTDRDLAAGDCRIGWQGGGAERRLSALMSRINDIVERVAGDQPGDADGAIPRSMERHG